MVRVIPKFSIRPDSSAGHPRLLRTSRLAAGGRPIRDPPRQSEDTPPFAVIVKSGAQVTLGKRFLCAQSCGDRNLELVNTTDRGSLQSDCPD